MDWQPIETAPIKPREVGAAVLLYVPGLNDWRRPIELPFIVVGVWDGGQWISDYAEMDGGYESTGDYISHPAIFPTHWMPLPAPPKSE